MQLALEFKPRSYLFSISHHSWEVLSYMHWPIRRGQCRHRCVPVPGAGVSATLQKPLPALVPGPKVVQIVQKTFPRSGVCCGMPCLLGCADAPRNITLINNVRFFITRPYGVTNNSRINHVPLVQTLEFKRTSETPCFFMWLLKKKLPFGAGEEWLCLSLCPL